jgi:hypothetical protein
MAAHTDLTNWETGLIRFTGFRNSSFDKECSEIFESTFDTKPEVEGRNAKELTTYAQIDGDELLQKVEIRPGRIDIYMVAKLSAAILESHRFPTLGKAEGLYDKITKVATMLLQLGKFHRVAIGSVTILPAKHRDEPYQFMRSFLGVPYLNSANYTDFLMRVNRPRSDKISGIEIRTNCVSSWSARALNAEAGSDGSEMTKLDPLAFATHAELDINTTADSKLGEVPVDQIFAVAQLLKERALETLRAGPAT